MVKQRNDLFLKAAQYAEESGLPQDQHLATILFPLQAIGGVVFGVMHAQGDRGSAELYEQTLRHHLERLSTTIEEGTNLTHRFEQLLQAVNETLAAAYAEGSLLLPIADAAGIIGVADNNQVIVSGFGNLAAQFLHKTEKERFEQYDLARSMRVEDEVPAWSKPFLAVLNGDLFPGDVFYLGSRVNRHDLSPSAMNEILITLPPVSAVNKIRQHLPLETAFAAIVLKAERTEMPVTNATKSVQGSLSDLDRTKEKTDRYLGEQSPEMKSFLHKAWIMLFPKRGAVSRAKVMRRGGRFMVRLLVSFMTTSLWILRDVAMMTFRAFGNLVRHPKRTAQTVVGQRHLLDRALRRGISRFNSLPKTSKRVLLVALIVVCAFIGSLVFINKQQAREAEIRAFEQSVELVENKLEAAEASLIYADETQARAFLDEASSMIASLDQTNEERVQRVSDLGARVAEFQQTLRHAEEVELTAVTTSAQEIFGETVSKESLGLTRDGVDVAVYNGKAYLLSPDLNQIFRHNRAGDGFDGGSAWVLSSSTNISDATAIAIDGFVWVLKTDGRIVKYLSGREEDFTAATVDPALIGATDLWTDENSAYLYVLDPVQKRIVVLEKENGALVIQYTSPAFELLRRFKIDESSSTIYVEAGTAIYQFTSR